MNFWLEIIKEIDIFTILVCELRFLRTKDFSSVNPKNRTLLPQVWIGTEDGRGQTLIIYTSW
jgi:hypothetical protein